MLEIYSTIFVVFVAFLPTILAARLFLDPTRSYALWAKIASVIAALAGLGWGAFGYAASHQLYSSRYGYFLFLALKHMCGGLAIGFVMTVAMARPYERVRSTDATSDPPTEV